MGGGSAGIKGEGHCSCYTFSSSRIGFSRSRYATATVAITTAKVAVIVIEGGPWERRSSGYRY